MYTKSVHVLTQKSEYRFFREQPQGIQTLSPITPTALANTDGCTWVPRNEWTRTVKRGETKKILVRKTKRGGCRSRKSRHRSKNKYEKFYSLGNNCFGLKTKKESLHQTIQAFKFPSCLTLQETKLRKMGSIKIDEYQVFEKIRPGLGGGLLTAIKENLNPVLISPFNEEDEIIIVQCQINEMKIRMDTAPRMMTNYPAVISG